ncbi:hypothetical protein AG1IA_09501 [Rhizoctonia solani AG-1 IA]|uniref:Uncharacterized protein n=1 Tax=Thanatephorus cucumeris (strain AG1-IA) TaxID=983506 RepID=L8WET2_THACA|nr:hypothetical protein AG1IA_09501 [Rhizoctonia solani AG-1 IA]
MDGNRGGRGSRISSARCHIMNGSFRLKNRCLFCSKESDNRNFLDTGSGDCTRGLRIVCRTLRWEDRYDISRNILSCVPRIGVNILGVSDLGAPLEGVAGARDGVGLGRGEGKDPGMEDDAGLGRGKEEGPPIPGVETGLADWELSAEPSAEGTAPSEGIAGLGDGVGLGRGKGNSPGMGV